MIERARERHDLRPARLAADTAYAIAQRLQARTVWVNEVQHLSLTVAFGDLKQSGLGMEAAWLASSNLLTPRP